MTDFSGQTETNVCHSEIQTQPCQFNHFNCQTEILLEGVESETQCNNNEQELALEGKIESLNDQIGSLEKVITSFSSKF